MTQLVKDSDVNEKHNVVFVEADSDFVKERYMDKGFSGKNAKSFYLRRQGMDQLAEDVRNCGKNCIVIADESLKGEIDFQEILKNRPFAAGHNKRNIVRRSGMRISGTPKSERLSQVFPKIYYGDDGIREVMRNEGKNPGLKRKIITKRMPLWEKIQRETGVNIMELLNWLESEKHKSETITINDRTISNLQLSEGIKSGEEYAMIYLNNYIRMKTHRRK